MRGVDLGPGVVEYLCINCLRRWLLVNAHRGLVFVYSPQKKEDRLDESPV